MIKKIHYIWLGGNRKPLVVKKCIATWKKLMPDWEIIEWNESNVNLDVNEFCRSAYDAKKYAFAADILRFKILYEEGGLYFDTDVKMIKPFYDLTENNDAFAGFEFLNVAPGLVLYAKDPKNEILKEVLDIYNTTNFIKEDGSYNLKVVGDYFTEILINHGYKPENKLQYCRGFTIFPKTYFCPVNDLYSEIDFSDNTYSIHLYAASWTSRKRKISILLKRLMYRTLGKSLVERLKAINRR